MCIDVLNKTRIINKTEFLPTIYPCQNISLFKDLKSIWNEASIGCVYFEEKENYHELRISWYILTDLMRSGPREWGVNG
jgi:hypothetical protein